ncbi:MAG: hypothetical protein AAGF75_13555, partial [Cyanobacteria bacterium P01_H01_bin.130]
MTTAAALLALGTTLFHQLPGLLALGWGQNLHDFPPNLIPQIFRFFADRLAITLTRITGSGAQGRSSSVSDALRRS